MNKVEQLEKLIIFSVADLHKELFNKGNKAFVQEGFPIQVEQLPVLMCCYYRGAISQQEIADLSCRDKSSIQRTITYFVKHNLAEIVSDITDKRKNIVRLTENGNKLGQEIENRVIEMDKKIFENKLTSEEKETFIALTRKIKQIVSES